MPPTILKLISELGLRYAPSVQADMQAHGARIALLASDLAEVNPLHLRLAISRWATTKPFLPKAVELLALIDDIAAREHGATDAPSDAQAWCARRNAMLNRDDVEWAVGVNGDPFIRHRFGRQSFGEFKPEDGEVEWIHRATAEYHKRNPHGEPTDGHFRQTMAKWSAAKPWRAEAGDTAA